MQKKSDQILIGLTGNIATGKSIVRKMLEHLGASGIDADALAHRAISRESPGYLPVVGEFGKDILDPSGEISRSRLGQIVFSQPESLSRLEGIIHPLVRKAIENLFLQSQAFFIVIEAIKLIESGLVNICDSVWVTTSSRELQLERLVNLRGLTEGEALRRVNAQPPQEDKISASDVVIKNSASLENLWNQVYTAYSSSISNIRQDSFDLSIFTSGAIRVVKCLPDQAGEIATLITSLSGGLLKPSRTEIFSAFTGKSFLCAYLNDQPVGIAGWAVENFAAITDQIFFDSTFPASFVISELLKAVEEISERSFCEIVFFFLPERYSKYTNLLVDNGYHSKYIHNIASPIWQETASNSNHSGAFMFIKELGRKIFFT